MVEVAQNQGEAGVLPAQLPAGLPALGPLRDRPPPMPKTVGRVVALQLALSRCSAEAERLAGREIRHGHLFLFAPVCLGLGAAIWFTASTPPTPWSMVVLTLLLGAALRRSTARSVTSVVLGGLLLVQIGMLLANWETYWRGTVILDQPVVTQVTGVVERREQGAGGEWRYILRLKGTANPLLRRPPQRVSLLARSGHAPAAIGDRLVGRARLSPPSGPALPGLNDFAFQSYFSGIGAVGFFLGPPQTGPAGPVDASDVVSRFDAALFSIRDKISNRIRTVLPGDPGAFAASIITGERRSMSDEATEALRLSGLAHITAISGLNMALAAGIFFVGLRGLLSLLPGLAQRQPIKKIAAVGALIATTCYVLISGYQVSALRAYLMTAIMLGAVLFDRPAISLRNLALSAILILAVQPSAVMGPSFQMSFAATAALIAGYAGWRSRPRALLPPARTMEMRVLGGGAKFVAGTLATSLIGGLATAVFAVTHFHRLSTHGLEANLAAMPIISLVVMPAGFIAMLMMPIGLDGPFFWVMGQGLQLVLAVAYEVSGWGEGHVFPRLPDWFMPTAIGGMLLLTLLSTRLRHLGTIMIVVTLVAVWLAAKPPTGDVLISEDARLVAVRATDGQTISLAVNRTRPPTFVYDQWQPVLGVEDPVRPEILQIGDFPQPPDWRAGKAWSETEEQAAKALLARLVSSAQSKRFVCVRHACAIVLTSGKPLLSIDRPELLGPACDLSGIVVLAGRTRLESCRSGALLFSQGNLRATGAVELSGTERDLRTITIRTSFDGLPRPWTAHRLYDWRTGNAAKSHDRPSFDQEMPTPASPDAVPDTQ
jgi:ComEC/Rec2-related protein